MMRLGATRLVTAAAALALSAALAVPTDGQPATAPSRPAWTRLWAYRAARAEAVCGLAEKVRALPLGPERTLGAMLDEHALGPSLDAALLAVAEDANVAHGQDGAAEVTLELPPRKLLIALEAVCRRGKVEADLAVPALPTGQAALRCTAKAAAPAALAGGGMIAIEPGRDPFDQAAPHVREFWTEHVSAAGRRQARRDAWADAMGHLKQRLGDVRISDDVTLADYLGLRGAEADVDMGQFLLAARQQRVAYHASAAVVAVEVEVSLRTVYACVKAWLHTRGDAEPAEIRRMEGLIVAAGGESIHQLGLGWVAKEHLLKPTPALQAAAALASRVPDWLYRPVNCVGRAPVAGGSTEPAARAARDRAAQAAMLDARLGLAELLGRLDVPALGKVGDLAGWSRAARADLLTALQDARQMGPPRFTDDGAAEVTLELPAQTAWRLVFNWQRKPPAADD